MRRFLSRIISVTAALATVASVAAAQGGTTVSGRVTNAQGAPLPGANVFITGLNIGSQTNDAGRYTFSVTGARANGQTATLTARVIGYSAKSAPVTLTSGTAVTQDFVLSVNALRLGEVVVTGAGTSTTRERLTTTINTIDSSALRRAAQPQNVVSALSAQAPNVEVRTQSGEPGSSASIKIRGASSLSGTGQPLFVVDGQPIDNSTATTDVNTGQDGGTVATNRASDINPADIESIDILKSSAAAAIYGARASNGVVLITTKRGRSGATRYTFNSTEEFDHAYLRNNFLQTQYAQGLNGKPTGCVGTSTPNCTALRWAYGPQISGQPTYNHEEELFDTGLIADNNLQISGGGDRTTFFVSGGLTSNEGYFKGPSNKYNRASVRLKGTQQVSSKLNVGGNLSYVDDRGKYVQKGSNVSGVMLGALRTPPTFNNENNVNEFGFQRPYRFPNGTSTAAFVGKGYYDNPFFVLNSPGNRSELGRSIGNVNAAWNPLNWLNVQYTLGADYYGETKLQALPLTSAANAAGRVLRLDDTNLEIDHNLTATAQHTFGDNFDGTVTVGQNLNSRRYRQLFVEGTPLIAPEPLAIENTVSKDAQEFRSLRHIEAYFTQAEANLYHQLVINVGVRNDGFSTFGASNQRHNFPKASVAWTFTNALGNRDRTGLLSYGKLHYAYGETGKEPPVYGAVTALSSNSQFGSGFGDVINTTIGGVGGLITGRQLGNANLRPERNRESEYGADFAFLDNKVDFSATYYNKHSDDVIIGIPVNTSATGAFTAIDNAASLTNKGVELVLNARPVTRENFAWDIGVQFGRNRGNVTSLAGAQFIPYNNEGFTGAIGSSTLGYAPGVIRGFDFVRCGRALTVDVDGDGVNDDVDAACGPSAAKGALYLDASGLPVDDPTDRVIADPNPKYSMAYNTSIKLWNKVRISGLLDVRKGGAVWNGTKGILNYFGTGQTTLRRSTTGEFGKDYLTKIYPTVAGPGAGVVAFSTPADWQNWFLGEGGGFGSVSQQFVEDGSFVKLREIGITYTADQRWVRSLTGFSSADLRFAGRNLKTWSKYSGFDPEVNLGGAEFLTQGLDYFINPPSRAFVVSVSLNR